MLIWAFALSFLSVAHAAVPAQLRIGMLHPAYKTASSSFSYDKGKGDLTELFGF
jgi:hypothetical protein